MNQLQDFQVAPGDMGAAGKSRGGIPFPTELTMEWLVDTDTLTLVLLYWHLFRLKPNFKLISVHIFALNPKPGAQKCPPASLGPGIRSYEENLPKLVRIIWRTIDIISVK